jgi:hypothetical protein
MLSTSTPQTISDPDISHHHCTTHALHAAGLGSGTIRYIGSDADPEHSGGDIVGVEMSKPKGAHNGTIDGIQYFSCKEGHGHHCAPSNIKMVGASAAAEAPVRKKKKSKKGSTKQPKGALPPPPSSQPTIPDVADEEDGGAHDYVNTSTLKGVSTAAPSVKKKGSTKGSMKGKGGTIGDGGVEGVTQGGAEDTAAGPRKRKSKKGSTKSKPSPLPPPQPTIQDDDGGDVAHDYAWCLGLDSALRSRMFMPCVYVISHALA